MLLDSGASNEGPKMPDSVNSDPVRGDPVRTDTGGREGGREKVRSCRICGALFVVSDTTTDACEECNSTEPPNVRARPAKPIVQTAKGSKSSGGGTWITPPGQSVADSAKVLGLPTKTKWRSPPFVIRFPEGDQREQPPDPPPKPPSRLMALASLIQSRNAVIVFAVLAFGALLYWRYPRSFRLLGQKLARLSAAIQQTGDSPQAAPSQQNTSSQQYREAVSRQRQKEAQLQQRKDAGLPQSR